MYLLLPPLSKNARPWALLTKSSLSLPSEQYAGEEDYPHTSPVFNLDFLAVSIRNSSLYQSHNTLVTRDSSFVTSSEAMRAAAFLKSRLGGELDVRKQLELGDWK
jgi:hypothetical protein